MRLVIFTATVVSALGFGVGASLASPTAQELAVSLPAPPLSNKPDDIDTPVKDCGAYTQLLADIKALEHELKHKNFGYAGPEKRKALKDRIKILKRVDQRLSGFYLAAPIGCPLPGTMRGPGIGSQGVNPHDIYCFPRMKLSTELVDAVRWVETAKVQHKKQRAFFADHDARQALQRAISDVEQRLQTLGVPGGLYFPIRNDPKLSPKPYDQASPQDISPHSPVLPPGPGQQPQKNRPGTQN